MSLNSTVIGLPAWTWSATLPSRAIAASGSVYVTDSTPFRYSVIFGPIARIV